MRTRGVLQVVAVTTSGGYLSIYDGRTVYALGQVTSPSGGSWVCPSLEACTRHSKRLPTSSVLLNAPRAILRVDAWNESDQVPQPPPGIPASTNDKMVFQFVRPVEVLPSSFDTDPPWRSSARC